MHKALLYSSILLIVGCGGNETSTDDAERATDWKATVELEVFVDQSKEGYASLQVEKMTSSTPLGELSDQLFELAFSGDAIVYPPNALGEADAERPIDPKELYDLLDRSDTVYTTDILTGLPMDTVVDMSFTKNQVSSMQIRFAWDDHVSGLNARPLDVSFGRLVFDETGQLRGVRQEFYISMNQDQEEPSQQDIVVLSTDSLGIFQIDAFKIYPDRTSRSLADYAIEEFSIDQRLKVLIKLSTDFAAGKLYMDEVLISPMQKEPAA